MEQNKRISQIIIITCALILSLFLFSKIKNTSPEQTIPQNQLPLPNEANKQNELLNNQSKNTENKSSEKPLPESLPSKVDIPVPFTPQAPFAVWDDDHNEACEEAALIMVKHFQDNTPLDKETAEVEILDSIAWQKTNWNGHFNLSAEKIVQLAETYFKIKNIYLEKNPSIEDIKRHLAKGEIIIAPTYGRELKNPYFRGQGPIYHALIIRGYNKDKFITNDPGTKRGEKFTYSQDNLYNAIHSWPGEFQKHYSEQEAVQLIKQGEKTIIVVGK
ncbi:C39 family peptidase [bacterium]|nr:C39 family peptidase [bacterium]